MVGSVDDFRQIDKIGRLSINVEFQPAIAPANGLHDRPNVGSQSRAEARRALEAGILDTKGQTPDASMGSRLYVDTKRPNSRFGRVSRGVFALAEVAASDISRRHTPSRWAIF